MDKKSDDILNMIKALERLEMGDLARLVRIRNRILYGDVNPDDIDYVYDTFGRVGELKQFDASVSKKRSSRAWYLLPLFLSLLGGLIAYAGLRHVDPNLARNTLLLGIVTFVVFVGLVAVGAMYDTDRVEDSLFEDAASTIQNQAISDEPENVDVQEYVVTPSKPEVIPMRESEIHTISHDSIPEYVDSGIVILALEEALSAWKSSNSFVDFELVESDGDVHIEWRRWMPSGGLGLHTVYDVKSGGADNHFITVRLGNDDCHSQYQQYAMQSLKYIIAHELGHYLGLRHIDEEGHLMYSGELFDVDTMSTFDSRGYTIPDVTAPDILTQQGQEILVQIESVKKDLHEIVLVRQQLKEQGANQELLASNTKEHNETVLLLDSLDDDISCVELVDQYFK